MKYVYNIWDMIDQNILWVLTSREHDTFLCAYNKYTYLCIDIHWLYSKLKI